MRAAAQRSSSTAQIIFHFAQQVGFALFRIGCASNVSRMNFLQSWILPPDGVILPGITPSVYIGVSLLALLVTAVSKGGFGGGVGIISVPLMLQVADYRFVLGLWLPILIACDMATIHSYPREWNPRAFFKLSPGVLLGIIVATLFLVGANPSAATPESKRFDAWLKLMVAVISCVFLALQFRKAKETDEPWKPGWGMSLPIGFVAGITTMVAHAAGPVITMFMLPQKMEKRVFVGTTGRFFFIFNTLKVPFLISAGFITLQTFRYGAWLMVLGPIGVLLGAWLNARLTSLWFVRLVQISLIFTAGKLVYDARNVIGK
jgi:uncharacterized protein